VGQLIRVYRVGLSRELASATAYRGSLIIWMFGLVASPYISLSVWLAVLGEKASVGPYDRADLVQYYLSVSLISMLTGAWGGLYIAQAIRRGGLNLHLLRPWSYLHSHIINNIGEKLAKSIVLGPMILVVALGFRGDWQWSLPWWQAMLLPLSIIMSASISLLLNVCVGLIAFWTTDITGISAFYLFLESLLSGRLIPLELFPSALRRWLWLSPFRYTLSLPVEIVVGGLDARALLSGLGMQALWLVGSYLLYRAMWRSGLRTYSAVGG